MADYTIITSSVTPGEDGSQNFAFRRPDYNNVIWGVENMRWIEEETAFTVDITVFREQMEEGQIVANQVHDHDPQYDEFIKAAEEVIETIVSAIEGSIVDIANGSQLNP